jgi:hypothetical protein
MEDRFAAVRAATRTAALTQPGETAISLRDAVARGTAPAELEALVRKIRARAYTVTDADLDALRGQFSEDQLFEIIVAATIGAADERLTAAHRVLEQA